MSSIGALRTACVYTPTLVASAMVDAVKHLVTGKWLEPSVGEGAFLGVLHSFGISPHSIVGLDLEKSVSQADRYGHITRGVDFISWARGQQQRFGCVVGNPPYITIERLPRSLRERARAVRLPDEARIPRGANYWLAFMYASVGLLEKGGTLAFLLPAAYEYADYAAHWRSWIATSFAHTYTFRVERRLFADVQDGSVILIATGYQQPSISHVHVRCQSAEDLVLALQKTHAFKSHPPRSTTVLSKDAPLLRWDDVFDMRIGVVTGDNASFLLTEQQRISAGLPLSVVVPIIGRSYHIARAEIGREYWRCLMRANEPIWLFRPPLAARNISSVQKYLRSILSARRHFKVADRDVWWQPAIPQLPHGFLTGMSTRGPWISLNRMRGLVATNTLYTLRFKEAKCLADRAAVALGLLTSTVRDQLCAVQRVYPDGLTKLEPKDLRRLSIPVRRGNAVTLSVYTCALEALLRGDEKEARVMAEKWYSAQE
jgi:adenine-specific DNA-methyltransferase